MDFHGLDLNLLVAFNALMNERNVTRAATQVGVSQPAMSAALARLRKLFGDPLFLRSADGLLPTLRARDLADPIAQALGQIESTLITKPEFQPSKGLLAIKIGMSDYPAFVILPALLTALAREAPGVSLIVFAFNDRDQAIDLLDAGIIDIAIGVSPTHSDARISMRQLLLDEFVTILASDHPVARRGMNMKTYLQLKHILVSPEGEQFGIVDLALTQIGKKRKLELTLPQMFAVPAIVARTQLTATVLKRVALSSSANHLVLFPPPIDLPMVEFNLIWHRRSDSHPAQLWFREFVAQQVALL
jgi:DNA-binding transcriptional LysR family regulator